MPRVRPATSRTNAKLCATFVSVSPSRRSARRSSAAARLMPASPSRSASLAYRWTLSTILVSWTFLACSRRSTGAARRSAIRSRIPGRSSACSGYAAVAARAGRTSSDIEPGEEELTRPPIPLEAEWLPAVIEPQISASADVEPAILHRKLDVHLEVLLERLPTLAVAGVDRDMPAPLRAQRRARKLVGRRRHDSFERRLDRARHVLREADVHAARRVSHQIDVLLRDDRAHDDGLDVDDVREELALL